MTDDQKQLNTKDGGAPWLAGVVDEEDSRIDNDSDYTAFETRFISSARQATDPLRKRMLKARVPRQRMAWRAFASAAALLLVGWLGALILIENPRSMRPQPDVSAYLISINSGIKVQQLNLQDIVDIDAESRAYIFLEREHKVLEIAGAAHGTVTALVSEAEAESDTVRYESISGWLSNFKGGMQIAMSDIQEEGVPLEPIEGTAVLPGAVTLKWEKTHGITDGYIRLEDTSGNEIRRIEVDLAAGQHTIEVVPGTQVFWRTVGGEKLSVAEDFYSLTSKELLNISQALAEFGVDSTKLEVDINQELSKAELAAIMVILDHFHLYIAAQRVRFLLGLEIK